MIMSEMRRPVHHGPYAYEKARIVSKSRNNVPKKKKKSTENSSRALISNARFFFSLQNIETHAHSLLDCVRKFMEQNLPIIIR